MLSGTSSERTCGISTAVLAGSSASATVPAARRTPHNRPPSRNPHHCCCSGLASDSWRGGLSASAARVGGVGEGRHRKAPLELTIEVLLTAVTDQQGHRFDLDAFTDQHRRSVQPHARETLPYRQTRFTPKQRTEVRRLPIQRR